MFEALRALWPGSGAGVVPIGATTRPRRVLFTGAAGHLARSLLPNIRSFADDWRLVDSRSEMPVAITDQLVCKLGADCDADVLLREVDAVVHFAAQSKPAAPAVLRRDNVNTVDWLLHAMSAAGIQRLVYASSMHVMGLYDRHTRFTPADAPRPDGPYGESKRRAESLIQQASVTHGLQALVLRIGHAEADVNNAEPANWLAMDDLARLIEIGLTRDFPGVATVHAVTPHRGDDLGQRDFAQRFGMKWSGAPSYAAAMKRLQKWYGNDPVAIQLRGGVFASGRADKEFGVSRLDNLDS